MKFGKIQYLNLLVFDVFAKSYKATSSFKKILELKKSYPSKLNKEFLFKRIDAGFISSIASFKPFLQHKSCNAGIIANHAVWSVIVIKGESATDYQSATSNALCKVLNLKGEVLIGDRALKYYENHKVDEDYYDLGIEWYKKTQLPFVFGKMCFNQYGEFYNNVINAFLKKLGRCNDGKYKGIKIPHYLLMQYVKDIDISKDLALKYMQRIYYNIKKHEQVALNRFYRQLRLKRIKFPARF